MDKLLEHPGIVSWDFSMYRNMPFAMQYWNCFRSRLLGSLYERYGGVCIPNIRPSDRRSFAYCFDGLPTEATVAMGTLGALKTYEDHIAFTACVDEIVKRLRPKNIIVYGSAPERIFYSALESGVNVVSFPTQTSLAHAKGGN
jgi:outer membrane cobalamin receptor